MPWPPHSAFASSERTESDDDSASYDSPSPKRPSTSSNPGHHIKPSTPKRKRSLNKASLPTMGSRDSSRAATPSALGLSPTSQLVSPVTDADLHGVERDLSSVSRDSSPTPRRPRKPRPKSRGERKSTLSKEYVVESDDQAEPILTSPSKRVPKAGEEDEDVDLEATAVREEEGSDSVFESEEQYSEDDLPRYPATDPVKPPPPSTMPLVPLSQVSDLPEIPSRGRPTRQRRWKGADYEVFIRTQLTTKAEVDAFLASKWLSPEDIRRLEATGRECATLGDD